jgi:hypothetical protein
MVAVAAVISAALAFHQCGRNDSRRIVLWAWERPENLEFINPREVSVAFLAKTIQLRKGETLVKPRLQPLKFAPGTELIAVVRIESAQPALNPEQLEATLSAFDSLTGLPEVRMIQIDFDAGVSERAFYREMLNALRKRTPPVKRISITALASWCMHDDWLTGLPIDEAVPMLFRMGVERDEVRRFVASGKPFRSGLCRTSLGVSTDEPFPQGAARGVDRVYIFNPRAWTEGAVRKAIKEY